MRISDWSSDVCSSDLLRLSRFHDRRIAHGHIRTTDEPPCRLSFRPALRITRMAKRHADLRRQRTLERLVGRRGAGWENGRPPIFCQGMEFNRLKRKPGQAGSILLLPTLLLHYTPL